MANSRYTGKDVKITFGTITANFQSIEINLTSEKWTANASDTRVTQRGTGTRDAAITLKGWESDDANSADFKEIGELQLTGTAPTALTFTDTAGTPASRLPASFFTLFPLAKWRVDDASGGTMGPNDPSEWTCSLTPNNLDAP